MTTEDRYEFARMPLEMLRARAAQLGVTEHASMDREALTHAIERLAGAGATSSAVVKPTAESLPLAEPDSIFIDHGLALPNTYQGTRLRVLVRDPGTVFVYWESDAEPPEGWFIVAVDAQGEVLAEVPTNGGTAGSVYLLVEASRVARVGLRPVRGGTPEATLLELAVGELQPGIVPPERWIDLETSAEASAPSAGHAPVAGVPSSYYVSH